MNAFSTETAVVGKRGAARIGPDILSIQRLHDLLGLNEEFTEELKILMPHLRKITANWATDIPRAILRDETHQDSITIRDLNTITDHVAAYMDALYSGRFYEKFEAPLDGIALTHKTHGVNPGWATDAFANAFETAQTRLFFETRKANGRIFPAALRCLVKIMVLTIHLLNRRDHELNDVTPQQGAGTGRKAG